ncbi:MAG TPA: hypothetical protein VD996_10940, partial [Chitinophagaceae bacterium]|nr:hypothetical protein [Chitinophagaceae bacterium]
MYRSFYILFILLYVNLSAQQKTAEYTIGWPAEKTELHSISDKNKQRTCSILLNADSMKGFLTESNAETKEFFHLPRKPKALLLGGFFTEKDFYLFLTNGADSNLQCMVIDIHTAAVKTHLIPFSLSREKIADRISAGDHFILYTTNSKTAELAIHNFRSESDHTVTRHTFDKVTWEDITMEKNFDRVLNVSKIDGEGDLTVDLAASIYKLYLVQDTMYMVLNDYRGKTRFYTFNLANQQVSFKTLEHTRVNMDEFPLFFSDNSFLLENRLYYAFATLDSLVVQVYEFPSGNLIQTYKAMRDEQINFKNTLIGQEGANLRVAAGEKKEVTKTKQLLRKITDANMVLMAVKNKSGQVELSVGSYKRLKYTTGDAIGSGIINGLLFGSPLIYLGVGVMMVGEWSKSTRFKMLVNIENGEFIPGKMDLSINDKIDDYNKAQKKNPAIENLFKVNGVYHYAYYDRKER